MELGTAVCRQLGESPDAMIVFASPGAGHREMLQALAESSGCATIVGCSSAGEFTSTGAGEGLANVTAIRSDAMRFSARLGSGLAADTDAAARALVSGFRGLSDSAFPFRVALVLVDAMAGNVEALIDRMTIETGGAYRFFGGGAGDNAKFESTCVFCGTEVRNDAAVALEIVSTKPIGIGARHGWVPAGTPLRVTEAEGSQVVSLNAAPAVEAFEDHAEGTAQRFDRSDPMPFFLHNIVGVESEGGYKLRVPLQVAAGGAVVCAAEVPAGLTTHIMSAGGESSAEAAAEATRDAVAQVTADGGKPGAALFFDCVATRLRLGKSFERELDAVAGELQGAPFAGFNSHGQIVRADGQFSGFHNCTAVVCVLPA